MTRKHLLSIAASLAVWSLMPLPGCSLDLLSVSPARIKSAQQASRPLQRGPGAPGYFTKSWKFTGTGFLFDPSKIELVDGVARLRSLKEMGVLETTSGRVFAALDSFKEILGSGNKGLVRYQLSNDGSKWFFHDGNRWTPGIPHKEQTNRADEINSHIGVFHSEVGAGSLFVKAFLISPSGSEPVELKEIQATGIAPGTDAWD